MLRSQFQHANTCNAQCVRRIGTAGAAAPLQHAQPSARFRCTSRRHKLACSMLAGTTQTSDEAYDLVLSSGFLAFAYHSGFLQAVEEAGVCVGGVMGTSSGALSGSLYCAGYTFLQVAAELSRVPPIQLLQPSCRPWTGALSLHNVIRRLREVLPPTFEDLQRPFAVGVVDAVGEHHVITSGPLPEAVAASAAVPCIFSPVTIPGRHVGPFKDGGVVDRLGLQPWRQWRQQQQQQHRLAAPSSSHEQPPPALLHLIARSTQFSGFDDVSATGEQSVTVVRSPKSGANFWNLGQYEQQFEASRQRSSAILTEALLQQQVPPLVAAAAPKQAAGVA